MSNNYLTSGLLITVKALEVGWLLGSAFTEGYSIILLGFGCFFLGFLFFFFG